MHDDSINGHQIKSGMDYNIDIVPYSKKSLIYGLYTKLNEFERHFETISTNYKYIALTWLLATYAGIGFLLSNETQGLVFNHFIAVSLICILGAVGISLIWHLDMNVYHRFWAALFVEEVLMEEANPYLLQSRKITLLIDESRERVFSQGLLYLIANTLLLITTCLSCVFLFKDTAFLVVFGICFFFSIVILIMWCFMLNRSRQIQRILSELLRDKRERVLRKSS